ncbi:MAG: hypothetical protein CM1200mP3_05620 [Chloroflexota bacterium]|nr:MAG: hypothetical protein CM1200mP3_05620 [Chloroflexota bacterium]
MGRIKESLDNGTLMSNIGAAGEKDRKELEDWAERTGMNLERGIQFMVWIHWRFPVRHWNQIRVMLPFFTSVFFMLLWWRRP